MRLSRSILLLIIAGVFRFASAAPPAPQAPTVWGMLSQNTGCVIFAEGHSTKGKFYGVAVTTKTTGKLTVIEAQNYTLDQKEYLETQDVLNDLMQRAQKDHIKFVKIPEKYSPDLLESARTMCKSSQ